MQATLRRSALPNTYSAEAESCRVLEILRKLLHRMHARVEELPLGYSSLPAFGGWDKMAGAAVRAADIAQDLEVEAPSSSDSEGEDGEIRPFERLTIDTKG